jgi:hypothetical protein
MSDEELDCQVGDRLLVDLQLSDQEWWYDQQVTIVSVLKK